jgi:hypothetical protein
MAVDHHLLAPWKLDYTRKCIRSAHAVLDLFTSIEATRMRRLANIAFGRVFYSLRFLLLLSHQIWTGNGAHVISLQSLRIEYYINSLETSLDRATNGGTFRVAAIWLYALRSRVMPWYEQFRKLQEKSHRNLSRPLSRDDNGTATGQASFSAAAAQPQNILPSSADTLHSILPRHGLFMNPPAPPSPSQLMPLDTFDAAAFMPGNLGDPAQILDRMETENFNAAFSDMYSMLSPTLWEQWHDQSQAPN